MTTKIITEVYVENNYPNDGINNSVINESQINSIFWSIWFDTWLNALAENIPPANSYELTLRLTGDSEITSFNNQYRQKNQPTDVLAFAALENEIISPLEVTESLYLGDIVVSLDTAYQQAQEQGHSLITEVAWLASHGFLHLLGWDHPDNYSLSRMLQKQAILLKLVKITD